MAASFLGSAGKAQALPGGRGWSQEQNAVRWLGALCHSPGSARGAIALLDAEMPRTPGLLYRGFLPKQKVRRVRDVRSHKSNGQHCWKRGFTSF